MIVIQNQRFVATEDDYLLIVSMSFDADSELGGYKIWKNAFDGGKAGVF